MSEKKEIKKTMPKPDIEKRNTPNRNTHKLKESPPEINPKSNKDSHNK